jgi:hypothetical protein
LTKGKSINAKNMFEVIHDPIYQLLNELSVEFDIKNNLVQSDDDDDDDNSDEDNEDNSESNSDNDSDNNSDNDSDNENNSSESNESYNSDPSSKANTSLSSYNSNKKEYFHTYDKFNVSKILQIQNRQRFSFSDTDSVKKQKNEENKNFIQKYVDNPKILLTDFGLLQKENTTSRTVQTRYYRSPEIIFGLKYDKGIDLWALGCSLYELITGSIMVNVEKSKYLLKHDKDLINIKLLIEKVENSSYPNIKNMCSLSKRKDYIFNDDLTLKYFKNITYDNWKNNELISVIDIKIIDFIDNLLKIDPTHRQILSLD